MTLSTEIATPPKSARSRNSDFSVSCGTNSNWDFGWSRAGREPRHCRAQTEVPSLGRHFSSVSVPIGLSCPIFLLCAECSRARRTRHKTRKKYSFPRRINAQLPVRWSADFSEMGFFGVFCGVFCELGNARQTAGKSGGINMWARKQGETGCLAARSLEYRVARAILNLYRGIWGSGSGGFRGCSTFDGNFHRSETLSRERELQ